MAAPTKKSRYAVAKFLHWAGVVVIGFNLLSGWRLDGFSLEIKEALLMVHSGVGTIIFLLMAFRWWWRRKYKLYTPPRWWKRPSLLMQWVFYPLIMLQVLLGVALASVAKYKVLGLGFIPYSALAPDNEYLQGLFLSLHGANAILLIALVVIHGAERWRMIFVDDASTVGAR